MRYAHTVEQVRAAEAELMARLPAGTLMQRAATGLAVAISNFLTFTYGARVVLLIGSGDNGGDALYAGEKLARRGAKVTAILLSDKAHAEGLAALQAAGGRVGSTDAIPTADVVVDGIVGIGGRPGLRPDAAAAVKIAADHNVPIVAVDMPSGVDVDTGETPAEHVKAALTVTFGTHKICHLIDPAATACGPVHLIDIGLDLPRAVVRSLQAADVRALYPVPHGESDKYARGVLGLIAGSSQYPGAAVIATTGALAGPIGMLRYVGPQPVADAVLAVHPEVVVGEGRVQAWAVGSGLAEGSGEEDLIARVTQQQELPVVVDAGAISMLDTALAGRVLITPHAGELSSMIGVPRKEIEARRLHYALRTAQETQVQVLLKGATTIVAAADGDTVYVNPMATPWLATAGSGDVLAGLCGALVAAGLDEVDAGAVGAYLHAAAANLAAAEGPVTAMQVAVKVAEATRQLLRDEDIAG